MATSMPVEELRAAHRTLAEYNYQLGPVERGYANRTLYINLDDNRFEERPVTQQMKDLFTGGRGFALKLLWDAVDPDTTWDDPQNLHSIVRFPVEYHISPDNTCAHACS